ncbi:MAG: hypothetical protein L0H19_01165 [Salinisphaera sp.]|nr:hypothetical protein [Salinisphaera sp.]MDN5938385.1 hypothetical protein [Salinisphaera sp.]
MLRLKAAITRLILANAVSWLLWLTVFLAIVYCSAAAYLAISIALGPALAALLTGVGLLALVALPTAIYYTATRQRAARPRQLPAKAAKQTQSQALAPVTGEPVADWARAHTGQAMLAALAVGTVIAASPSVRRTLIRAAAPMAVRGLLRALQSQPHE